MDYEEAVRKACIAEAEKKYPPTGDPMTDYKVRKEASVLPW